mmetsp:Transcript_104715/g.303063  ORF Transcript_104715/g.303063 Transcript_104715/m.303063 type:complete len:429 (+) Transcript_104715:96-1382(+)
MGACMSGEPSLLVQPVVVRAAPTSVQDAPSESNELSLEQLGIHVPPIPGDIGLCGHLSEEVTRSLAPRYASWVYMNEADSKEFLQPVLQQSVKRLEVRPFPGPDPLPSDAQVAAALEAMDTLPRPLMLQCSTGNRAGALLLLWLAKKHGYSAEAARQFAEDMDLKFWMQCARCGPTRDWLLTKLPASDAGPILKPAEGLIFSQLFDPETWTFTYLLGCQETKEALLIDPVLEQKERDLTVLRELGLTLRYVVNTHAHADHITSGGLIRKELPEVRTVISKASGAKADVQVEPGAKVTFGRFSIEGLATPGHTDGCMSWLLPGSPSRVFTGDALLIRGCGRTDFQQGDSGRLYDSVHSKLFSLPGDTVVYPGHDYKGRNVSTIDEEKRFNPRMTKSRDEFVKLMSELNLPYPKKIDIAVPANMVCGVQD